MGTKNYLIEGGSGTGKTTVAEELERRGYHVVHGDRTLAYYGDPETGHPMQPPHLEAEADKVSWGYQHWIWPVAQVKTLLADQTAPISFFCGHSENSAHFSMLFHGVFVLEVYAEVLRNRLDKRPEDEFGGRPIERELVMRLHKTRQNFLAGAVSIDASQPVDRVVDDILSRCSPTQADEQRS